MDDACSSPFDAQVTLQDSPRAERPGQGESGIPEHRIYATTPGTSCTSIWCRLCTQRLDIHTRVLLNGHVASVTYVWSPTSTERRSGMACWRVVLLQPRLGLSAGPCRPSCSNRCTHG